MKTLITYLLIVGLVSFADKGYSQSLITIGQTPKQVPQGKKWVLATNQKILMEVTDGSLITGNLCNARLLSNPNIVTAILEGEYGRPNSVYGLLSKGLEKTPYTNANTYSIIPLSVVDNDFSLSTLKETPPENAGKKEAVFMPGQKVYVSGCLVSIQLIEANLSQSELQIVNQKRKEQEIKEKSLEYKPVGNRLLNILRSDLNGKDDWSNKGITGLKKIIIRDKEDKFILINEKGIVTTYDIGSKKNLENGQQEFEIGRFDKATLTFNDNNVKAYLRTIHHQDMGHTYISIDATSELITDNEVGNILKQIEVQNHIADSIRENTYPKYVSSKELFEAFFIKKKSNGQLKAQWINQDKRIVNFSAVVRDHGIRLIDFSAITLYPELRSKIEKEMSDKAPGMYYFSVDVIERVQEVKKGALATDHEQIFVHEFYEGTYGNPKERYK